MIKKEEVRVLVFFSQTRIGKNGKKLKMNTFRSICVDAEKTLTELLKYNKVEGPRVTKVGRLFISKTSIDELP